MSQVFTVQMRPAHFTTTEAAFATVQSPRNPQFGHLLMENSGRSRFAPNERVDSEHTKNVSTNLTSITGSRIFDRLPNVVDNAPLLNIDGCGSAKGSTSGQECRGNIKEPHICKQQTTKLHSERINKAKTIVIPLLFFFKRSVNKEQRGSQPGSGNKN